EEAGPGKTSKSTVARISAELRGGLRRSSVARSMTSSSSSCSSTRSTFPAGPAAREEGAMCAWEITENGDTALVSVRLGMREAKEDWLELGRDLTSRGFAAPR